MKNFLLLASVLMVSTALLGAESSSETVNGVITKEGGILKAEKTIQLVGKVATAIELTSTTKTVDFGTVLIGRSSSADIPLLVKGEEGFKVKIATTGTVKDVAVTEIEEFALSSADNKKIMHLVYTPTDSTALNETLTVTATYTDVSEFKSAIVSA
ncbi:hypothetical protein [uncultured Cetobacterium sp.]|uniref:hypothetical protein n=1 Tax=uncultured Cetobacterium sp. TaxID=527638 RepID=UPI00260C391A|nr:hypothetical protein [uncultured Cetobacterium sp.]